MYALFQWSVTPATVTAFLTILGFSLYDTVVVFDKVSENERNLLATGRSTYGEMVNRSLNQVLMRSLSTTLVALLPVLSLLIVGSVHLRRDGARGLRARARGRSVHRFVLVDLRRRAAARVVEGAGAAVPGAPRPAPPHHAWPRRRSRPASRCVEADDDDPREKAVVDAGIPGPPAVGRSDPSRPRTPRPRQQRAAAKRRVAPSRPPHAASGGCGRYHLPMAGEFLRKHVRDIPDYPQPGIIFKDITPLLAAPDAFAGAVDALARRSPTSAIDKVLGIEARGFVFAAPVAYQRTAGFVPVRKAGKLPWEIEHEEYELEYGTDLLEIHRDAVEPGERVLIVDDVIATGGTAAAAARLVERLGGEVVGLAFLLELGFLAGRTKLPGQDVHAVVCYA